LVPADLLMMLQSAKRAVFEACNRKETHPLYVIYSMAAQSFGTLLSTMEDFLPCFDQTSAVNRVFREQYHYYQHINDLIGPQPEEKEPPPNPHSRFGFLYSKNKQPMADLAVALEEDPLEEPNPQQKEGLTANQQKEPHRIPKDLKRRPNSLVE
jgi:hypothetical protein